jgi:hypothetical protein
VSLPQREAAIHRHLGGSGLFSFAGPYMTHVLLALAAQVIVGLLSGRWLVGGLAVAMFYLGREITQAEYRWISAFGAGGQHALVGRP